MTDQSDAITPNVIDDIDSLARANADAAADALSAVARAYPDRFTSHQEPTVWAEVDRDDVIDLLELIAHLAESIGERPAALFAEAISDYTQAVAAEVAEIQAGPVQAATCPRCSAEVPKATRWFGPCECQQPAGFAPDAVGKADQSDQDATAVMHVYAALVSPGKPYEPDTEEGTDHIADLHGDLAHHAARHGYDPDEIAERGLADFAIEHEDDVVQQFAASIDLADRDTRTE